MGKRANRANRNRFNSAYGVVRPSTVPATPKSQLPVIHSLPKIVGAEFNKGANDVAKYQAIIDKAPKRGEKIRVLFSTEASYLCTGFSTYLREVFKRLHATGKYELAELGSYGAPPDQDQRTRDIPWKYYHVLPANELENRNYRSDYNENQFGKWKFTAVVADFKPDIVMLNRDHWMDTWVLKNPLRENFLVYWMPTVDGFPQRLEWLTDYGQVDRLFTYSWFGKRVLETQSALQISQARGIRALRVEDVCQPGVDLETFKPLNKEEVYKIFGIPNHVRFIGTVMRNQPRKLFPRIIESFADYKRNYASAKDVMLLLHTSIPDVGWDIPELILQNGLQDYVVFSYMCHACGNIAVSTFLGVPATCPVCKKPEFQTPNTQFGFQPEHLNLIYNLMSVYIQGSIAEGDGMPVNEAKACGVPCLLSDYSALHEKAHNGGALPILSETLYTESETGQWRDLFDRQDLTKKIARLMGDENERRYLASEARKCAELFYNWDLCAKKWEAVLDTSDIKDRSKTWNAPIELKTPNEESPSPDLTEEQFLEYCYTQILRRKGIDNEGRHYWLKELAKGATREQLEQHFRTMVEKDNERKLAIANSNPDSTDPVVAITEKLDPNDKHRILYCMPETAGDVFISTGVVKSLKEKFPEASIYFATQKKFFNILEGNPDIKAVLEYNDAMLNYRNFETWGPQERPFDQVFCPFIVTQRIPHWIHGGHGEYLGDVYAHMCCLNSCGEKFIMQSPVDGLPEEYITVHSQTRQDPKDYDHMQKVVNSIHDIAIVQIGGKNDKKLDSVTLDLRGRTTPQQLAYVLRGAELHLGLDSFPMHIALHVGTPVVAMFGGTYMKQGTCPRRKNLLHGIETQDRGLCPTSCHLIECEARKIGLDKCINNIPAEDVVVELDKIIPGKVTLPEPIVISSYIIVRDGIKYGFPFEKCIEHALKVSDEVVVVDGESTDGTKEKLIEWAAREPKLKFYHHGWDFDNPTLFGDEKTFARRKCTGNWLIQLDADEMIVEPTPGAIRRLIERKRHTDCIDLACINFYGDNETIRIEPNMFKWRISRNDSNIIHGVHAAARIFDPQIMKITMDKKVSDSCEYIYADTGQIINHTPGFNPKFAFIHRAYHEGVVKDADYIQAIKDAVADFPVVFHYSWLDLNRKIKNGGFWDQTFHGKRKATHNTTEDITVRVNEQKDKLLKIEIDHPLKNI